MGAEQFSFFDSLNRILTPDQAASVIASTRSTIYDMHYRPSKYNVPEGMFLKNGRKLLVRTDKLKDWFISRNER